MEHMGGETGHEATVGEREACGIRTRERERRSTACLLDKYVHHRLREVDARHRDARVAQRERDPAGPHTDLEAQTATGELGGEELDELRHRVARERARAVIVLGNAIDAPCAAGRHDASSMRREGAADVTVRGYRRPRGEAPARAHPSD